MCPSPFPILIQFPHSTCPSASGAVNLGSGCPITPAVTGSCSAAGGGNILGLHGGINKCVDVLGGWSALRRGLVSPQSILSSDTKHDIISHLCSILGVCSVRCMAVKSGNIPCLRPRFRSGLQPPSFRDSEVPRNRPHFDTQSLGRTSLCVIPLCLFMRSKP